MLDIKYQINKKDIMFSQYPFKCSYASTNKIIPASSIQEMVETASMPSIRVNENELVFISAEDRKLLVKFCVKNAIPINKRADVWGIILDAFLDTTHSEEWKQKGLMQLYNCGISELECNNLRQEVAERMVAYNFASGLWEWVHLGLSDVLYASSGYLSGEKHRLSDNDFEKFYFKAMDIALKGIVL